MPESLLGILNAICCFSAYDYEKEPLIITSAKRSVKRTRKYLTGKRGLKDIIPLKKEQEYTITHTALSRKRQFIINELVETERRYVERLSTLQTKFISPLLHLESDCTPLRKLNVQLKQLKTFHSEFLEDLSVKSIPLVFNKKGDFLKLTQGYVNLHPEVSNIIETLRNQSKEFKESIKNNELVHRVQLIALLIEPVQRIPRYQLLLEDILANTPDGHPELEELEKAFKKIETIVRTLNEARRSSDGTHNMYSIYQRIRGRGSSLWAPSRLYIRENVFWRVFQGQKFNNLPPARVRAFLFSDCIVICEDQKIGRSYKFQDEISLCSILSLDLILNPHISFKKHKMSTDVHGFELSAHGLRTLELYHSNEAVIKKWFELIIKHKRENTNKKKSRESFIKSRASTQLDPELLYGTRTNSNAMNCISNSEATSNYGSNSNYGSVSSSNALIAASEIPERNHLSTIGSSGTVIDRGREYSFSSNESDKSHICPTTSSVENLLKLVRRRSGKYTKISDGQPRTSIAKQENIRRQIEETKKDNSNRTRQRTGKETAKKISPFVRNLLNEVGSMKNPKGKSAGYEMIDSTNRPLMEREQERSSLDQSYGYSASSELLL